MEALREPDLNLVYAVWRMIEGACGVDFENPDGERKTVGV